MTTNATPTLQAIANIWSEMQRLGVPMRGWWHEPEPTNDTPEPHFGMEVAKEALNDWDADWMTFNWDAVNGWTMDSHCEPGPAGGPVVMDVTDPFDVPAVASYFKAVIDGEVSEFRTAP